MKTVTLSPKYQVVIPRQLREDMELRPGQLMQVLRVGDRIELVPVRPMREMRGILKGIDTAVPRDEDRQ